MMSFGSSFMSVRAHDSMLMSCPDGIITTNPGEYHRTAMATLCRTSHLQSFFTPAPSEQADSFGTPSFKPIFSDHSRLHSPSPCTSRSESAQHFGPRRYDRGRRR